MLSEGRVGAISVLPGLLARAVSALAAPILTLGFLAGGFHAQVVHAEMRTLHRDQPQEHDLDAGETDEFRLTLAGENYLYLMVEQKGIDVAFSIHAPDGHLLERVDGPGGPRAYEVLVLITENSGDFVVKVEAPESDEAGSYRIWIDALRPRASDDELRVEAEKIFTEGLHFEAQATGESRRMAMERFRATLPYWERLGDKWAEAFTHQKTGYQLRMLGDLGPAREEFETAIWLWDEANDSFQKAGTLNNLGAVLRVQGDLHGAFEIYQSASALARDAGNKLAEANSMNNLGWLAGEMGDLERGIELLERALEGYQDLGDRTREAAGKRNLGDLFLRVGESDRAIAAFRSAIEIGTSEGENRQLAYAFANLAVAEQRRGRYSEAIEAYEKSLQLHRIVGNRVGEAEGFGNLARLYLDVGELAKAKDLYRRALRAYSWIDSLRGLVRSQASLAHVLSIEGRSSEAISYLTGVLNQAELIDNPALLAIVHDGLGRAYESKGSLPEATRHAEKAMNLRILSGDRSAANLSRLRLAAMALDRRVLDKARSLAESALRESRILQEKQQRYHSTAILAEIARASGNTQGALELANEAIRLGETLRRSIAEPSFRVGIFGTQRPVFELASDLLFTLHSADPRAGFAARAFSVSEAARARVLVEAMSWQENRSELHADKTLLDRRHLLLEDLSDLDSQRRQDSLGSGSGLGRRDPELSRLLEELDRVENAIHNSRKGIGAHRGIREDVDIAAVQSQLDSETLLLEFLLGEERSFVWAISRNRMDYRELPSRGSIEAVARRLHLAAVERNRRIDSEDPTLRRQRLMRADHELKSLQLKLGEILLGPISRDLEKQKVWIVPDGALHYIPFSALYIPGAPTGTERYWIETSEISYLPAASLLFRGGRERSGESSLTTGRIAVFADPVFATEDVRIDQRSSSEPGEVDNHSLAFRGRGLARLPFTRAEATSIIQLAGPEGVLLAMDSNATKALAMEAFADYGIVHLATHGVLDTAYPSLSSIVLSLYSKEGLPLDGFLRLQDLYHADIQSELVVLSGCETALGRETKGEGLVGLTWGFLYAGAANVVASLWEVPDRATSVFMGFFYQALFEERMAPATALRTAQRALIDEYPEWSSPYFWAGFVAQGSSSPSPPTSGGTTRFATLVH